MKIGILATGITPDELINEHGSYADMFIELFKQAEVTFDYAVFDVRENDFPASAQVCDGWIITGSKFNVYQDLPWMQQLKALILDIHREKKPLIGICFGHQIIAEVFGGRVDKYPQGWGVGLHSYELRDNCDFIDSPPATFTINAMHQDQVLVKPDNAEVFASSDFCDYAGLVYGDLILTIQAHPEFSVSYEKALLNLRKGSVIPEAAADQGLTTLRESDAFSDSLQVTMWMADFLRKPRR